MGTRPVNILFFLPDQHRPDWLGGNPDLPVRTPNLDRLCEAGVRFSNAFTPSPLCAPARACLAAARDYAHCRVPSNRENFPLDLPTYYQRLHEAGYRACGVGKFDLHKDLAKPRAELDWHLDGSRLLSAWGFTEGIDSEGKGDGYAAFRAAGRPKGPYLEFLRRRGLADAYAREHDQRKLHQNAYVTVLPEDAYSDNWIAENGLRFLRGFPEGRPWHLVVNFTGPHSPMDVTQRMHDQWAEVRFPLPVDNEDTEYSPEHHQRVRQHYAAMIENIDRHVGRFLDAARERGDLDNTLVVYASDHGEMLGDHGRWGKATWHTPSTGIPLLVAGPGVEQGVTSDALVCLQDLAATFLDVSGADPLPRMEARSLRRVLAGETDRHRDCVVSGLRDWRMVFDGRYKLVVGAEPALLLYDTREDAWEQHNLAEREPGHVARLERMLHEHERAAGPAA